MINEEINSLKEKFVNLSEEIERLEKKIASSADGKTLARLRQLYAITKEEIQNDTLLKSRDENILIGSYIVTTKIVQNRPAPNRAKLEYLIEIKPELETDILGCFLAPNPYVRVSYKLVK